MVFSHRAKQFTTAHLETHDVIVVMDRSNERNVKALITNEKHHTKVHLMRKWDSVNYGEDVPDPWYGGPDGFEEVFKILNRSTAALLDELALR